MMFICIESLGGEGRGTNSIRVNGLLEKYVYVLGGTFHAVCHQVEFNPIDMSISE